MIYLNFHIWDSRPIRHFRHTLYNCHWSLTTGIPRHMIHLLLCQTLYYVHCQECGRCWAAHIFHSQPAHMLYLYSNCLFSDRLPYLYLQHGNLCYKLPEQLYMVTLLLLHLYVRLQYPCIFGNLSNIRSCRHILLLQNIKQYHNINNNDEDNLITEMHNSISHTFVSFGIFIFVSSLEMIIKYKNRIFNQMNVLKYREC